jgi:hypothetical protein
MSLATTEPTRHIAADIARGTVQLAYRLGSERYALSYPCDEAGTVRALLAVQRWLDADCNFDRQACDEVCAMISEMSDAACIGK